MQVSLHRIDRQAHHGRDLVHRPIVHIIKCDGLATAVGHREKVKRAELRHRERIAAIEKGIELPPDPLDLVSDRKVGSLRGGIMGVRVGIANLISYFVEARSRNGNGK